MTNEPNIVDVPKADFCIEIQYRKESENPSRVFHSMSGIIDSFQEIDRHKYGEEKVKLCNNQELT